MDAAAEQISCMGTESAEREADVMSPNPFLKVRILFLPALAAAALLAAGCGSSLTASSAASSGPMGSAFVVGTDAPLASVVSLQAQLKSITLTSTTGTTANMLGTNTPTVDFARYNGLQGLVDMNDVPAGTYNSVTINLGPVSIGYLDTTKTPPAITTETATLTTSSVTIPLNKPLVITASGGQPVGLRIDLDLAQSVQTSNGAITGTVDPTFDVTTVARTDQGAHIDEFVGAVTTPPSSATATSFVITGPHGEPFTINVSSSTQWDGGATLASLNTNSIVAVAGQFDPADQTLDADEVALVSDTAFYAGGLVTYVTPSSGAASSFDFYVRRVLPDSTAVQLGDIAQVNLTGNEKYGIYWMHNAFTNLLFNSSALVPGQEISVGGQASAETNLNALTVSRIYLQNWGYNGTIVAGSQNSGQGTFQMQVTGFAGVLVPSTVTVYLGPSCDFRYGFGAFGDLSDGAKVRVVGLLLKNTTNGQLVLLARHLDGFNFTDFSTTAWQ
jgi:hypothetical protein